MNPLNLIPAQYRILAESVLFAVVIGALLLAGLHWLHARDAVHDAAGYARGHAEAVQVRADWQAEKLALQQASILALAEERDKRAALESQLQRIDHDHAQTVARLAAQRDAARADADGMRHDIAAVLTAATDGDQAPAAPSAARLGQAAGTLGELLGACVQEYQSLAADADADRAAGIQCQQRYDALIIQPPGQ